MRRYLVLVDGGKSTGLKKSKLLQESAISALVAGVMLLVLTKPFGGLNTKMLIVNFVALSLLQNVSPGRTFVILWKKTSRKLSLLSRVSNVVVTAPRPLVMLMVLKQPPLLWPII